METQASHKQEYNMRLGAYSVVRYADDVGDQRINLGVFVWHPVEGYRCRFSPSLDRVQAIDPRVAITPLRRQIEQIKETLSSAEPQQRDTLECLSRTFRHGLVVSDPYPAKISSVEETLDRLYGLVVSPVPEIRRASSQKMFENSVKKTLEVSLQVNWPKGRIQQIGRRVVNGIPINVGLRTRIRDSGPAALWHPLSLQSEIRPEAQLAAAKATVLDIFKTRDLDSYKYDRQYVPLLAPRAKSAGQMDDIVNALKAAADQVWVANDNDHLFAGVQAGLQALQSNVRRARS
jgi:Protein of unknown function (DUF3037)